MLKHDPRLVVGCGFFFVLVGVLFHCSTRACQAKHKIDCFATRRHPSLPLCVAVQQTNTHTYTNQPTFYPQQHHARDQVQRGNAMVRCLGIELNRLRPLLEGHHPELERQEHTIWHVVSCRWRNIFRESRCHTDSLTHSLTSSLTHTHTHTYSLTHYSSLQWRMCKRHQEEARKDGGYGHQIVVAHLVLCRSMLFDSVQFYSVLFIPF